MVTLEQFVHRAAKRADAGLKAQRPSAVAGIALQFRSQQKRAETCEH